MKINNFLLIRIVTGLVLMGLILGWAPVHSEELNGVVTMESRFFKDDGLHAGQERNDASISLKLEYFLEWDEGNQNLLFVPYLRQDSQDEERSHFDIRDLYWVTIHDRWELYFGIRKIFWGVTESQHLVDIINQTDLVDNPNGEEKLGQPMVHLSLVQAWATLDLFVLGGFRERTFPGKEGRFRFPLEIDNDHPVYEAKEGASRTDFAIRSIQSIGDIELGFSFFSGTSRDPKLEVQLTSTGPVFVPHYNVIQQAGLEAQWNLGDWLLKWESITRQHNSPTLAGTPNKRYSAYTTGFEYTLTNFKDSGADWGFLIEYLYDDRGKLATTPFEQDIFMGTRFALNDVQSTDFLLGMIKDLDEDSRVWSVEGSRRWGENLKMTVEGRAFADIAENDLLFSQRKDGFLKFDVAYFW